MTQIDEIQSVGGDLEHTDGIAPLPVRDAIAHAWAAGAHPLLASLLVDQGPAMVAAGEEDLIVRALASLSPLQLTVQPALLGVSALAHRGLGDTETAARLASRTTRIASRVRARLADQADGALPSGDDLALLTDAALLEAWQARMGWTDVAGAIAHARALLGCHHSDEPFTDRSSVRHTPHQPPWPLPSSRLPWLLNELAAAELWTGQLALAETHTGEALVAAEALGQHRVAAGTYANRALIEMIYGRLHDASMAAKASLVAARRAGRTEDSLLARAHLVHAYVAYSHLHLDPAAEALERVQRISERATDPLVAALAEHLAARLLAESGDLDAALAFQSGPTVPDELPAYLVWVFALVRAQWALRVGDREEARRLAQEMLIGGWPEGHGVLTAILTDLDGDHVSAAHQLDHLMAETTHAAMLTTAIAAVYKVRMLLRDGNPAPLGPALHDMLARVGPHRLYSALIFTGPDPALDRRLRQEAARARPQPYAAKAADALDRYRQYRSRAAGVAGVAGTGPEPGLTPLTAREADVLRELALGGEYADVAQALFVSENTVKTHIGRLYRKLGAERRADALRTARARGLL